MYGSNDMNMGGVIKALVFLAIVGGCAVRRRILGADMASDARIRIVRVKNRRPPGAVPRLKSGNGGKREQIWNKLLAKVR